MGRLQKIFEDGLKIRIKGKPSVADQLPVTPSDKDFGTQLEEMGPAAVNNLSDLNQFRTLSSNREVQYRAYDEMAQDSVISSALEMYSDDATQYNKDGAVIWAESENTDVAAFANRLIDVLDLNANAWSHIYQMVKYGDLYLETFRDDEPDAEDYMAYGDNYFNGTVITKHKVGSKMEEYIEAVNDPSEIFDLYKRGKTVGFIRIPTMNLNPEEDPFGYQYIMQRNEVEILPSDKFIHICLANNSDRAKYEFRLQYKDENSETGVKEVTYTIRRGKSILHDLYRTYKEISLMEDSLILNRVTKSSLIRILQIEVGDMPKSQARELLKRIKNLIEQKNFMNKNDGTYSSMASPGPVENVIYVPTHDGKGAISSSNLGGDVDVKSIIDVDYFKNKLYAGLKIPKQFLGEDDGGGFSAGTSLTKLDSRYARTIKRVQNAYIAGITTLINLFALDRGLTDHVNNFVIKMQSPSTTEDSERDETLSNRINIVGSLLDMLTEDVISSEAKKDTLVSLLGSFLNLPEVAEIMEDDNVNPDEESEEGSESGGHGGFGAPSFDNDIDIGGEEEPNENEDVFDGVESLPGDEELDTSGATDFDVGTTGEEGFGDFESEV